MFDDWEVLRPPPKPLSEAQLAVRAKGMTTLKTARNSVKAIIQPGDSFPWLEQGGHFQGSTATISHFQDQWCWIKFTWPNGKTQTKNIGFVRVAAALKLAGRIK